MIVIQSFSLLCLLLALGKLLRVKWGLMQRLYLPSSVIAGLMGLILLQVVGQEAMGGWIAGWNKLPGLLINVVFASLFLGVTIPPLSRIWKEAGPQLAYGQIVAWGQYVVGLGMVLIILGPWMKTSPLFGVIVPVGFEGGHGTAGGLGESFKQMGWEAGLDFGLAAATAGMISAIIVGMALVNWAVRTGVLKRHENIEDFKESDLTGVYLPEDRPSAGALTVSPDSIDALTLHLAVIGIAILIGYGLKLGLVWIEAHLPGIGEHAIMRAFPLFPLCMIGGLLVQISMDRCAKINVVDHHLMQRVGGLALDFLVVAAIATIRIEVIAKGWLPFVLIILAGIAWNVFCVMWLAKRLLPDAWFERAIAEMGQSMGVTATGLLLLRVADPERKTPAASAFGYKQLLHEPFMGGGLWTSTAVILVWQKGAPLVFAISIGAILTWLVVWKLLMKK
ncbi:MAG: sodium/glutamate symporter [Kiritimatiellia bacterium]|jgi:ESS family glutamate:Na+ symporter|nr:sodium/glutamate symporter [Kiritimatiellia bacterium]MDP6810983.1 sodium/glutamate symporter [Kiritimatiellia bacterium]MDP7025218.1 sodium/glutamate symporter [Kiritimatiellia bacterium]